LGAGATVLGNIVIGDDSTVGSQAVVTKDVRTEIAPGDGSPARSTPPAIDMLETC
jgi:serine acetyltransferase